MSLNCDMMPVLWPLPIALAVKLSHGRLEEPDMARILWAHREFDRYNAKIVQESRDENRKD
jgi:hypothetical protein